MIKKQQVSFLYKSGFWAIGGNVYLWFRGEVNRGEEIKGDREGIETEAE